MMICVLLATVLAAAQASPPVPSPVEMMTYQMVLLKKGPNAPPASPEAQKAMQDAHLANLAALNKKRINLVYGPVTAQTDLQGMAILAVDSADEATRLFASDPFITSGVMVAEVHPWMGPKGWFQPPASYDVMNPAALEPLILGFLVRAPDAPPQDAGKAAEIQKGHLAYMATLHAQGKLVVAGPFRDAGARRGLVVYRVKDVATATALAADDPAVKAGRLVLEAYPWTTFKGIIK